MCINNGPYGLLWVLTGFKWETWSTPEGKGDEWLGTWEVADQCTCPRCGVLEASYLTADTVREATEAPAVGLESLDFPHSWEKH